MLPHLHFSLKKQLWCKNFISLQPHPVSASCRGVTSLSL